jgi:hypothetical protein
MAYSARDTALAPQKLWYFDSGASDHITGDRNAFDTFRNITPFSITHGDESKVLVTGKGSVVLNVQGGADISFSDVLFSQHFGDTCLLSVAQLARRGASITFKEDVVLMKHNGKLVSSGTLCQRVGYKLDEKESVGIVIVTRFHQGISI